MFNNTGVEADESHHASVNPRLRLRLETLRGYTGARFSPALVAEGVLARPSGQCAILRWFGCIFEILLLDIGDRMGITKRKYVRYRSKSRTQVEE